MLAALAAAAACSLDESGSNPGDASLDVKTVDSPSDGPSDAPIDVPQACSTLDASACVDAALPDGWTYAVVATGDQACPAGDFTKSSYVYGLGLEAGACACANCTTTGSWSCAGQVEAGSHPGCDMNSIVFDAGDDASCIDTEWNDPHVGFGPLPQPSGSPACSTTEKGTGNPTYSAATACTPGCTVDYCGTTGAFKRCIVSTTSSLCPAPFTQSQPLMGTADKVAVSCEGCACKVQTPGACSAAVTASVNSDCSGSYGASVAPNTCATPGGSGKINSFLYVPQVPQAICALTDGGTGTATFASSVTVCCLP